MRNSNNLRELMLVHNSNSGVELLRVKKRIFALIFNNRSDDIEGIARLIQNLPDCYSDPDRLNQIRKTYEDIANLRVISLEDVYSVFGIDCESNFPLFCNHKRQCIKQYREVISRIIEKTQDQIRRNINKINICSLTYSVFFKVQEFSEEKPKYISNMWFLGNSTAANTIMKKAFEAYTRAAIDKKNDPEFCANCLIDLFEAIKFSVKDSFRIHYLDSVVDQLYFWYFIESEASYDFLIFMPDAFDEIKDFLLETINKNPFFYFVKQQGYSFERCEENETCLDGDSVICVADELLGEMKCFRDLTRLLDKYYHTHRALRKYGMFNCICYDITDTVPNNIMKGFEKQKQPLSCVKPYLNEKCFLFKYTEIIQDKEEFVRTIVKPRIHELYKDALLMDNQCANQGDLLSEVS